MAIWMDAAPRHPRRARPSNTPERNGSDGSSWPTHPDGPCIRRAAISDLYITGTRIRLRRAVETTASGSTTSYKFTQKVPAPAGGPGLITTMYLNEAEHSVLSGLPGSRLTKTRYSVPPFGVDVFTGTLAGLLMAEIEFESAEEEKHFPVPPDVIAEVTADPRLSGGRLTLTKRSELMSLLGEFSLEPLDASELAARTLYSRLNSRAPRRRHRRPDQRREGDRTQIEHRRDPAPLSPPPVLDAVGKTFARSPGPSGRSFGPPR